MPITSAFIKMKYLGENLTELAQVIFEKAVAEKPNLFSRVLTLTFCDFWKLVGKYAKSTSA